MFNAVAVPYVAWQIMSLPISSSAQDGDSGGKKPTDLVRVLALLLPSE